MQVRFGGTNCRALEAKGLNIDVERLCILDPKNVEVDMDLSLQVRIKDIVTIIREVNTLC